ncbi:MAG TPA: hypothetical protein VEJ37_01605 [Xanthobacteraceae bacterium]|nr:hypothetical protein [Xanthobacteraceae bacterium]
MAYILPRAVFVLIAWAMTCVLIKNLWPAAHPMIFGIAGAIWTFGGIAYFSYLRKLRRDIEELERRRYSASRERDLRPLESPAAE